MWSRDKLQALVTETERVDAACTEKVMAARMAYAAFSGYLEDVPTHGQPSQKEALERAVDECAADLAHLPAVDGLTLELREWGLANRPKVRAALDAKGTEKASEEAERDDDGVDEGR